jgi:hypothetical protein
LKVAIIGVIGILFVGGALALGGLYYAARKVHQKLQASTETTESAASSDASSGVTGKLQKPAYSDPSTDVAEARNTDSGSSSAIGEPCRYLTKEEVGAAIGAAMTRVEAQPDGCVYYAHGDPASMVTKHTGALLSSHGADAKEQQMLEKVTGAFFQQQQSSDQKLSAEAATGEVPVLSISFSSGNAEAEFRLNEKMMGRLGTGRQAVDGVGDQAFALADTSMTFRKGQTLVRLIYAECPCNTQAITPLARKLADQL